MKLESPQNAAIAVAQAAGRILDNDSKSLLSVGDTQADEGSGGTTSSMNFKITLLPASDRPVSVNYATAERLGVGWEATTTRRRGQVTFAEGETEKVVSVTILGDDVNEANETVVLNLSHPTFAVVCTRRLRKGRGLLPTGTPPRPFRSATRSRGKAPALRSPSPLQARRCRKSGSASTPLTPTAKAGSDDSARNRNAHLRPGREDQKRSPSPCSTTPLPSPPEDFFVKHRRRGQRDDHEEPRPRRDRGERPGAAAADDG